MMLYTPCVDCVSVSAFRHTYFNFEILIRKMLLLVVVLYMKNIIILVLYNISSI